MPVDSESTGIARAEPGRCHGGLPSASGWQPSAILMPAPQSGSSAASRRTIVRCGTPRGWAQDRGPAWAGPGWQGCQKANRNFHGARAEGSRRPMRATAGPEWRWKGGAGDGRRTRHSSHSVSAHWRTPRAVCRCAAALQQAAAGCRVRFLRTTLIQHRGRPLAHGTRPFPGLHATASTCAACPSILAGPGICIRYLRATIWTASALAKQQKALVPFKCCSLKSKPTKAAFRNLKRTQRAIWTSSLLYYHATCSLLKRNFN